MIKTHSHLQSQIIVELELRSRVLEQHIGFWSSLIGSGGREGGWRMHYSQVKSVLILLNRFKHDQRQALDRLKDVADPAKFATKYKAVEDQLSYVHEVLAIFRAILAQREHRRFDRDAIDAADLIAASCCGFVIDHARTKLKIPAVIHDQYRVPPLTYLNAEVSPAVLTRARALGDVVGFKLSAFFEEPLPMPLILLPLHHIASLWTFSTIYHEVGHILDDDLGLSISLGEKLRQRLGDNHVPEQRINQWCDWRRELVADALGVLLGGEGFAYTLIKLLLMERRTPGMWHPSASIRIGLLRSLLEATEVAPLVNAATIIMREWEQLDIEMGDSADYQSDCGIIATALLNEALAELNDHSLRDLNPELDRDHVHIHELADYLVSGTSFPVKKARRFPDRLVPAAAQIAVHRATLSAASQVPSLDAIFQAIHNRGLLYIHSEPRSFLDSEFSLFALSAERLSYLEHLAASLSFRHAT